MKGVFICMAMALRDFGKFIHFAPFVLIGLALESGLRGRKNHAG